MKFRSFKSLIEEISKVQKRFPVETFFVLVGTCAATINVELKNLHPVESNWCIRVLMASNLGLVLNLAVTLFLRNYRLGNNKKKLIYLVSLSIPILLLFLLNPMKREADYFRFIMIAAAFHLLVSFVPFLGMKSSVYAFWQFNKTLFLRFLSGALFSIVLFLGLSAAIGAMNYLFNFDFEWDTYAILWIWIAGLFQTVFFLSGVPHDFALLEENKSYPKGLKIFTQYVLIPLATVYVVILLAYEVKILLEWNMPKGLVSSLVLGYAVFGILSLLLVYPIRNNVENKWILNYSKTFYLLMIPLIVLPCLAISVRVSNYGITEERYFLIVLAFWLSFITVYFLISHKQNILLIPLSLALVILLSVYGPQSAFSIARKSQLNELKQLFITNKSFKNFHLQPISASIDSSDRERIRNVVDYLITYHGLESLQPVVAHDLGKVTDSVLTILKTKGTSRSYYHLYEMKEKQKSWVYNNYAIPSYNKSVYGGGIDRRVVAEPSNYVPLNQADFLINVNLTNDSVEEKIIPLNLQYKLKGSELKVKHGKDSLLLDLQPMLEQLNLEASRQNNIAPERKQLDPIETAAITVPLQLLTNQFSFKEYECTFMLISLSYEEFESKNKLRTGTGILLLKKKK